MISRNGVCYDLTISEYRYEVDGVTFVFSSKLHLDKFQKNIKSNRDILNYSLTKRFNILTDISKLADLVLYKKIETRGFLVIVDKGTEICQNNLLKFAGGSLIQTSYSE